MSIDRNDPTPDPDSVEKGVPWREALKDGGWPLPDDDPLWRGGAQLFIVRRPRPTETEPDGERT